MSGRGGAWAVWYQGGTLAGCHWIGYQTRWPSSTASLSKFGILTPILRRSWLRSAVQPVDTGESAKIG